MSNQKYLIIVAGPTAVGKTALGIQLAQAFKTVVLSADSRQFYREMTIGTAKPDAEELAAAKHYLVDSLSINDAYNVGDFERDSINLLNELFEKHDVVLMVGGSGLFIKAVCEGLDEYPDVPDSIRKDLQQVFEEQGIEALQQELKTVDPQCYENIDIHNSRRLTRALEVYRASGKPFSSFQNQAKATRIFTPIKILLTMDRQRLYERINYRVDLMLKAGLEAEAKQLALQKHLNALQTVGYQEWFDYFDGKIDQAEAIRLIKRNSRRYAKRQMTWFRKDTTMNVFDVSQKNEIEGFIRDLMT